MHTSRRFIAIVLLVLGSLFVGAPRPTRAQGLFDGLPEPSLSQYELMWQTITGMDYVAGSSSLFLGYEVGSDTFELVVFQPTSDGGSGSIAEVIGTVTVLEAHPYQWLLPFQSQFDIDSGTDEFQFSIDCSLSAASVLIDVDGRVTEFAVAGVCETTTEILAGTGDGVNIGETATYSIIVPLGFVDDPAEAGEIAQRVAAMAIYQGEPIDPNLDGGTPPGGNTPPTMIDPDCETKCTNSYNTATKICRNNLAGSLRNCALGAGGAAIGGCLGGAGLCAIAPPPLIGPATCCAIGAVGGVIAELYICTAIAQTNFDVCMANAWEEYRLCMLNECDIVIAAP